MDPKKGWEDWKGESRATPSSGDFKYTERVENGNSSVFPNVGDFECPEKS